jgi:hypothetical protein
LLRTAARCFDKSYLSDLQDLDYSSAIAQVSQHEPLEPVSRPSIKIQQISLAYTFEQTD